MKSFIKNFAIISMTGIVITYLLISFINWNANPGTWSKDVRGIGAFIMGTWILLSVVFSGAIEDYKK